jgi:hypothetical protein
VYTQFSMFARILFPFTYFHIMSSVLLLDDAPEVISQPKRRRVVARHTGGPWIVLIVASQNGKSSRFVPELRQCSKPFDDMLPDINTSYPPTDTTDIIGAGVCSWKLDSLSACDDDPQRTMLVSLLGAHTPDTPLLLYDYSAAIRFDNPISCERSSLQLDELTKSCVGATCNGVDWQCTLRSWCSTYSTSRPLGSVVVDSRIASALSVQALKRDLQIIRPRPLRLVFHGSPSSAVMRSFAENLANTDYDPLPPPNTSLVVENMIKPRHSKQDWHWGKSNATKFDHIKFEVPALIDAVEASTFLRRKDSISPANNALNRSRFGAAVADTLDGIAEAEGVRVPGRVAVSRAIVKLDSTAMLVRRVENHRPETRWRYLHPDASPQLRLELFAYIEYIIRNPESQTTRPFAIEELIGPIATLAHGHQSVEDKAMRLLHQLHRENGPTENELRQATLEVTNI